MQLRRRAAVVDVAGSSINSSTDAPSARAGQAAAGPRPGCASAANFIGGDGLLGDAPATWLAAQLRSHRGSPKTVLETLQKQGLLRKRGPKKGSDLFVEHCASFLCQCQCVLTHGNGEPRLTLWSLPTGSFAAKALVDPARTQLRAQRMTRCNIQERYRSR